MIGIGTVIKGIFGNQRARTKRKIKDIEDRGKTMQQEGEASFDRGVDKGKSMYDSVMNEGAMDSMMDARSAEKKEIAARRRDMSRGMNAKENQAARSAFEAQIRRAGSGARKQMAANIANSGLQGGVANAQRRAVESDIAQKRVDAARNLMLGNIALKQQGLAAYENTMNSQEAEARQNLLNRLNVGLAGGQQNAQMYSAIQNMITSQKTDTKNARDGLLGGNIIPGLL